MEAYEQQLQAALAAHAQAPEDLGRLREICTTLCNLKRDDELLPWAEKALALNPREADFVRLRAHAFSLVGKHFDAAATWQHYASLLWNAAFYDLNLGHNLVMAGDFERGIPLLKSAWQAALASDDGSLASTAERLLGEAMLKTGDAQGLRTGWRAIEATAAIIMQATSRFGRANKTSVTSAS
jgi:hypothetical protein